MTARQITRAAASFCAGPNPAVNFYFYFYSAEKPANRHPEAGAWPKDLTVNPDDLQSLPFAVLEAPSRALLPVLLALFHSRVARQKSILSQSRPQLRIED